MLFVRYVREVNGEGKDDKDVVGDRNNVDKNNNRRFINAAG